MLLLDGLDEFDGDITVDTEDNVLSQIMGGDKFKECVVIIATRPWRAGQNIRYKTISKEVYICFNRRI